MATALFLAVLLVTVASIVAAGRYAATDGGPGPRPPGRRDDEWSVDLPAHPYATDR